MCIIIGKYFDNIGWVGIKNRDRNYIPEISFKKKQSNDLEILYFWDDITEYCEGMNSSGIGILSASLMVQDDEKEIEKRGPKHSLDGAKIRKALTFNSVIAAAKSLIEQQLTGNTLIFDQDSMFLLEASWRPNSPKTRKNYIHVIKKIPKDQIVTRTNHGIWLDWAGYQRKEDDPKQSQSRISSESRKMIADYVSESASDPEDIIDGLTQNFIGHGQLNALRTSHENKKMRTTAQLMIIPRERTLYVRPVQSHISFDFWELNKPKQQTWVEILSNRVLYMNLNNVDQDHRPPFDHNLDYKL